MTRLANIARKTFEAFCFGFSGSFCSLKKAIHSVSSALDIRESISPTGMPSLSAKEK
jgi:hypothetical protein